MRRFSCSCLFALRCSSRRRKLATFVAALGCFALHAWAAGATDNSVPTTNIKLTPESAIAAVKSWRIVGPFRLPSSDQEYNKSVEQSAFMRDFLSPAYGRETPLSLQAPTTRSAIDFTREDFGKSGRMPVKTEYLSRSGQYFLDQVINAPTSVISTQQLYQSTDSGFNVTYLAANLNAMSSTDVALIASSDSPTKIWLNGNLIADPSPGSVGHAADVRWIRKVHLNIGLNTVLVKLLCFPERNDFALRVSTLSRAQKFVDDHGGLPDVLDSVFVPTGTALKLSGNLDFFASKTGTANVVITDVDGREVARQDVNLNERHDVPTQGLQEGILRLAIHIGTEDFTELFYLGQSKALLSTLPTICQQASLPAQPTSCTLAREIALRLRAPASTQRLDRAKPLLVLLASITGEKSGHSDPQVEASSSKILLRSFVSRLDGQREFYYLHIPSRPPTNGRLPLVVIYPTYYATNRSFFEGPPTANIEVLQKHIYNADRLGLAVMIPFVRGLQNIAPIADEDILEAIQDGEEHFPIDKRRIYLEGDCAGARSALLLAEHHPDLFAAASLINIRSYTRLFTGNHWSDANNPLLFLQNVRNIPLLLINGATYPHSPIVQARVLENELEAIGIKPQTVVLPESGTHFEDEEAIKIAFQFLLGKRTPDVPERVTLASAQPRYSTAYWLRVDAVVDRNKRFSVDASITKDGRVRVRAENVAAMTLRRSAGRLAGIPENAKIQPVDKWAVVTSTGPDISLKAIGKPAGGQTALESRSIDGPIAEAFASPFLIVWGTGGEPRRQVAASTLVDNLIDSWKVAFSVQGLQAKKDTEITPEDVRRYNLIVVGDIADGSLPSKWKRVVKFSIAPSFVQIADQTVTGTNIVVAAICPVSETQSRSVVFINYNGLTPANVGNLAVTGSSDVMLWKSSGSTVNLRQWNWDSSTYHLSPTN